MLLLCTSLPSRLAAARAYAWAWRRYRYSDLVVSDLFEQFFGDPALEPNPKLNPTKVTLANFFASRILVDEGVAQQALAAAKASSGALLVLVAEVDRVKFGFGVPARLQRAAQPANPAAPPVEVEEAR